MSAKKIVVSGVVAGAIALAAPLIEMVEGTKYTPYYDVAGVLTVCNGITGSDVVPGKTYSPRECRALLNKHIETAAKAVDSAVKVDIPDSMRASLYSFTFNVGASAFRNSTMLKLINQGKLRQACDQLFVWNKITKTQTKNGVKKKVKVVSNGLNNRRKEEFKMCVKDLK